jgi:hypothetical protein
MIRADDSLRLVKPGDVYVQDLDGEAVLLNLNDNQYYGLDENGFRMFSVLTSSSSVREAFELLLKEYDVDPTQLTEDLEAFIASLHDSGLVEAVDG